MRRTALVWDERLMWHDTGLDFGPIGPTPIEPCPPHERAEGHVARIRAISDNGGG